MPRNKFPEFKGMRDELIKSELRAVETDCSFHGDYSISYTLLGKEYSEHDLVKLSWQNVEDTEHPANKYSVIRDACWGELPYLIQLFCQNEYEWPKWLLFRFRLNPFECGAEMHDDYDDYYEDYDSEEHYDSSFRDLMPADIYKYCDWLVINNFIRPFDVDHFINYDDGGFGYLNLDMYHTINQLYFAATLCRYMHEGQNIVRRINALNQYDLDPYVNIVLSHELANYHYNGGHCVCAMHYWKIRDRKENGLVGGDYWKHTEDQLPEEHKQKEALFLAKIAYALYMEVETPVANRDQFFNYNYPYFSLEDSCGEHFKKLSKIQTPNTWRGLLSLDTRRSKCVNSVLGAIQKCSLKTKAA